MFNKNNKLEKLGLSGTSFNKDDLTPKKKLTIKNNYSENKQLVKTGAGFTVIELIVSVAIIAVISGAVLWNGRGFNDRTALNATAEDISLAIRLAQNYGSTVRESSTGSSNFNVGYGIAFDSANPSQAIIFADTNGNSRYDGTSSCDGECIEKVLLRNGATIQTAGGGVYAKNYAGASTNGTSVSFTFLRPSLNATIVLLSGGSVVSGGPWASGNVVLKSPSGITKIISVNAIGQVSIQ